MEEGVDVVVGVGVEREPALQQALHVAGGALAGPDGGVHDVDVQVDADLSQVALDLDGVRLVLLADGGGDGAAVGIAGFRQQGLGLFQVGTG